MTETDSNPATEEELSTKGAVAETTDAVEEASPPAAAEAPDPAVQIARLKEQLLRTAADFDNFRKRARRDIDDSARRAKERAVMEVLPLVDNLERAVDAASGAEDVEAVVSGIRMVLRSFTDISGRLGLERVPAKGEAFDPNVHDAVQQMKTDEHPAGTIVAEVTPGYRLGDKLLRAALVVVAQPTDN